MISDEEVKRIVGTRLISKASRGSLYETRSSPRCAGVVSHDMNRLLNVFRIELPAHVGDEWPPTAPTICMVPEELKRGDKDNGCYDPVAVRIGLCRGLPAPTERAPPAQVQIKHRDLEPMELPLRKTEEVRKVLKKEYRDLEQYKSSCVVQLLNRQKHNNLAELMVNLFESTNSFADIAKCHSNPDACPRDWELQLEARRTLLIDGCFILHRLLKYAHIADRVVPAEKKKQGGQQGGAPIDNGCFIVLLHRLLKCAHLAGRVAEKKQHGDQGSSELSLLDISIDYGDDDWTQTHGRCFVWQLVTRDLLLLENQIPFFVLRGFFKLLKKDNEGDETLVKGGLMLFRALCPQMLPHSVSVSDIASNINGVHHLLHLFYLLVCRQELKHPAGPGDNNEDDAVVQEPDGKKEETKPRDLITDVLPSELPQWIAGAKELLEAGIRLRKRKNATSFLDVRFDDHSGVLEIPPLQIYDYSEALFRNMIAFEQTYAHTHFDVSTYSVFMNCLVSTAEDARILHLRGILVNMMNGGDQDGGRHFFDRICSQVHFPSNNYLVDTMAGVSRYTQSRRHRWRAALVRDYFSNPWVAISVVAAVLLLCLTVLQTVFTVYPYFKPSN